MPVIAYLLLFVLLRFSRGTRSPALAEAPSAPDGSTRWEAPDGENGLEHHPGTPGVHGVAGHYHPLNRRTDANGNRRWQFPNPKRTLFPGEDFNPFRDDKFMPLSAIDRLSMRVSVSDDRRLRPREVMMTIKQNRAWYGVIVCALMTCCVARTPAAAQHLLPNDQACIAVVENHLVPAVRFNGQEPPHRTLAERMAVDHVPGVSIAVIRHGKIVWARGYGVTRPGGPAVTPETPFQAGSVSKPVLAMAVLRLVQSGRLDLDTDVNRYLTSWKVPSNAFTKEHPVTLRELLDHTAGMTDSLDKLQLPASGAPIPTQVQILNGAGPAKNAPVTVTMTPGTAWRYSNGNYDVLAQLLQDVNKAPFAAIMQTLVLDPIGMTHSSYVQPLPESFQPTALPFDEDGTPVPGGPLTIPQGSGGLWSTPSDLARYALDLQSSLAGKTHHVLTPPMSREMVRPQIRPSWLLGANAGGSDGLGLELAGDSGHVYVQHAGYVPGFNTLLVAYVHGDGAVIMTNGDNGDQLNREVLHTIAQAYRWPDFYNRAGAHTWPDFRIADHKTIVLAPDVIDKFAGHYQLGQYIVVNIAREGDHLLFGDQKLFPVSERTWFDDRYGSRFTFDEDASGHVTQVTLPLLHVVDTPAMRLTDDAWGDVKDKRATKVTSQAQDPLTEAALRRVIVDFQSGRLNYARFTPGLADAIRGNLPNIHAGLAPYGALRSLSFTGVTRGCDDTYTARFENGSVGFALSVMPDGTIWRIVQN